MFNSKLKSEIAALKAEIAVFELILDREMKKFYDSDHHHTALLTCISHPKYCGFVDEIDITLKILAVDSAKLAVLRKKQANSPLNRMKQKFRIVH